MTHMIPPELLARMLPYPELREKVEIAAGILAAGVVARTLLVGEVPVALIDLGVVLATAGQAVLDRSAPRHEPDDAHHQSQ